MQFRSGKEIRSLFIKFWESKGSHHYRSFSLVPDDPTLMFTIAGMVPFKKYYLGIEEPEYPMAVTSQKCVRTNDIENVGRTARHHTFFEMLGNFTWGGYFKRESLTWGWEFLTEVLGMDGSRMYATIYQDDDESFDIWNKEIGLPPEKILRCGEEENFWFMGPEGPCGPDSEVLYDQGESWSCGPQCKPGCDCDRYLEIWNHVFTQFDRQSDGTYLNLPRKNIDTGMGLERLTSIIQGVKNDFETDLFMPLMNRVTELSSVRYGDSARGDMALKVISDHLRSVCFMLADGILPANEGSGYVLRRLLRRAARYGRLLGMDKPFLVDMVPAVIQEMGDPYSELIEQKLTIEQVIRLEENRFGRTVAQGTEMLQNELSALKMRQEKMLNGELAFQLYDTWGFPLELTREICAEDNVSVDEEAFHVEMERQRSRARASSKHTATVMKGDACAEVLSHHGATPFLGYDQSSVEARVLALVIDGHKVESMSAGEEGLVILDRSPFYGERGGQVGDQGWIETSSGVEFRVNDTQHPVGDLIAHHGVVTSGQLTEGMTVTARIDDDRRQAIRRNHTATHLLHQTLIDELGGHVRQNGSLVTPDVLRFDYTHYEALSTEQILSIEKRANAEVLKNEALLISEMSLDDAKAAGAKALFEEKYGDVVRVVTSGTYSCELCGGTHVERTGDIGLIKVVSEESIGSGIRRITAVTGLNALNLFQNLATVTDRLSSRLGARPEEFSKRLDAMDNEIHSLRRDVERLSREALFDSLENAVATHSLAENVTLHLGRFDGQDMGQLREAGDKIKDKDSLSVVLFFSKTQDEKAQVLCMVGEEALKKGCHAGTIVKAAAALVGGGGGGRPNMATAGGKDPSKIDAALAAAPELVLNSLSK